MKNAPYGLSYVSPRDGDTYTSWWFDDRDRDAAMRDALRRGATDVVTLFDAAY